MTKLNKYDITSAALQIEEFTDDNSVFNVFSYDFFSPKQSVPYELNITDNTYSIHHFTASWVDSGNKEEVSPAKGLRNRIKRLFLLNKKVVLMSNSWIDKNFSNSYKLNIPGPLFEAEMSVHDFEKVVNNRDLLVRNNLFFIKDKNSKRYTGKDLNYPIAKIKDSDLEVHFIHCYSREQALKNWNDGISYMENNPYCFLIQEGAISRFDFYKICFFLNLHKRVIRLG